MVLLSVVTTGFAEDAFELRAWTTRDGSVLEAKLLKREANTIFMKDENGQEFKVAFAALSIEDQEYVAALNLPSLAVGNAVARQMKISKLLGDTLETASGVELSSDAISGKVLGLYVAAKSCEPCEGVTSNLTTYVEAMAPEYKSKFQIVYVGVDTNAEDEKEYLQRHGVQWLSVPFESEGKARLLKKFKLNVAPALLIVKYDGTVLDNKGLRLLEANDVRMLEAMIKPHVR